jgi:hypothetical protein
MARLAPFECELGRTALLLMSAVDEDGGVRPEALVNVAAHLPPWVRLPRRDWRRLREALREEWASAHPLMGL